MNPNVDYCTAFQDDASFGALYDAFSYRWTASCIANSEYEPSDMRKPLLHALACATSVAKPFMVVLILPAWEDSPWRTHAILQHPNLTTLAHLPANQLKFIPSHIQLDKDLNISTLRPAVWPVDLIIIANEEGRQAYLHHDRLQNILISGLQQACQDTNLPITLFPNNTHPQQNTTALVLPTHPHKTAPKKPTARHHHNTDI